MQNKIKILLIILGLVVIAGLGFYYFYYLYQPPVNYLIAGVSYYGFYNHFFDANSSTLTSVADILDYWGDQRFDLSYLKGSLLLSENSLPKTGSVATQDLQKFFKNNGYETYRWASDKPGNEIKEIKKFVNPEKKVPVIVFQKKSAKPESISRNFRVIIGVMDKEKKVIAHDNFFGSNYEISYEDFEAMFQPNARAILAVWPSAELAKKIKGPDYNLVYPQRLDAMDQLGEHLVKSTDALAYYYRNDYEKSLQVYQEFLNDPKLKQYPPAYRVVFYNFLATLYFALGKPDEVIKALTNQSLPINKDLNQPYGIWTEQIELFKKAKGFKDYKDYKFLTPYYWLAKAYLLRGDKKSAKKQFEEIYKVYPEEKKSVETLEDLLKSPE